MSLTLCNVHFSDKNDRIVYVSGPLYRSLKLSGKKKLQIKLGRETVSASVKSVKGDGKSCVSRLRNPPAYPCAKVRQCVFAPRHRG